MQLQLYSHLPTLTNCRKRAADGDHAGWLVAVIGWTVAPHCGENCHHRHQE